MLSVIVLRFPHCLVRRYPTGGANKSAVLKLSLHRPVILSRPIGRGRGLAASPLPHHRTYGSRLRRFGRLSQGATRTPTGVSAPGVPVVSSSQASDLPANAS